MEKTKRIESTVGSRLAALVSAGTLAACMAGAPLAFAAEPSAGAQTGTGTTSVNIQLADPGEHSGTDDPTNPDGPDPNDLGDNIAFTVPSEINFVANANGELTGPSAEQTYIENESVFPIHGSSLEVVASGGWNIIDDGAEASAANSIDFQVGPTKDMLDAFDYTTKAAVSDPSAWNMAAGAKSGIADRVQMESAGNIYNVDQDIIDKTKVAEMHWYVTPGKVS